MSTSMASMESKFEGINTLLRQILEEVRGVKSDIKDVRSAMEGVRGRGEGHHLEHEAVPDVPFQLRAAAAAALVEHCAEAAVRHGVIHEQPVGLVLAAVKESHEVLVSRNNTGEQLYDHNTNTVSVVDEEYRNQRAANSLGSKGMFQLIQTKGSSRNLMALLNTDGSVTKTWHVDTSDGNGNLNCSTSSEKSVGNSMSDPLQIGKAEAVNMQFGSFGISAWLNDKGGTSHTGSVDDLRAHSRETSDRYFSSFGNSPKLSNYPSQELMEDSAVYGSEEADEPPDTETDEDLTDEERDVHEIEAGSVDEQGPRHAGARVAGRVADQAPELAGGRQGEPHEDGHREEQLCARKVFEEMLLRSGILIGFADGQGRCPEVATVFASRKAVQKHFEETGENDSAKTCSSSQVNEFQRLALACDDGSVRLYNIPESGSSDSLIRGWDSTSFHKKYRINIWYRITAGLGGANSGGEIYIWSLLFLRCGTLVSGDSFGSVQFWNSRHETHLQAHTYHIGDVNALATVHSQSKVFSAGADGQVILYKVSKDGFGADKEVVTNEQLCMWVYVGYVRAQTQEVRALTMAVLNCREDALPEEKMVKIRWSEKSIEFSYHKWAHLGVPMLISGGGDTKLFAYSAREFTQFAPHNFCPAPQRPLINLARDSTGIGDSVMLVQFTSWLDVLLLTVQQTKSNRSNVRDGLPMALRGELWQVFLGMIVQVMADARTSELEETELSRYHFDVKRCDIAGICGYPGKNNKGELSEFPRKSVVLSSCLHMMPRQKSEGSAVPTLWAPGMDGNIEKYDFRDQETPMMNMIAGGAAASSFVTHHNELNMKLYMRIAPGLYLKELVVGELDRVYEIWKPFRNEGIDLTHNPEFTTCEFYMAYADCNVLMELTEIMLSGMVKELPGGYKTKYHAHGVEKPPIEIDAFYDWRCTQFSSSVHCLQSTAWGQAAFQREGNVTDVGFERGLWLDWTWAWLNEAI